MQATAAHATSSPALSRWQQEVERLADAIPTMPPAARSAVRKVLVALLDDQASDERTRQDVRRLLAIQRAETVTAPTFSSRPPASRRRRERSPALVVGPR